MPEKASDFLLAKLGITALSWFGASLAYADQVLVLTGEVQTGGADHVLVPFEVPAGTQEILIEHSDLSDEDILDFGLNDPNGFRGWGGGNTEPIVVAEKAASRSYLAGPIAAGTWNLVIGKAKLVGGGASYEATVTLRDVATLPPQPEREPYLDPGVLAEGETWYAGDFHVHSRESGDAQPTIAEIADFAREKGLDFVELSEHNTTSQLDFLNEIQSRTPDLLFLPGVEFTTYAGHANGIGATAFVDHKIGLTLPGRGEITIGGAFDAFHEMGALVSINHPAFELGDACIGCAWAHETGERKIDAVELATAATATLFLDQSLAFYEALADSGQRPAALGGSDDHRAGVDEPAFNSALGSPTTMVRASELSVAGILEGVRRGNTVVKVRGPQDPMVEFEKTLVEAGALVEAHIEGGAGMQARFVVDGVPQAFVPLSESQTTLAFEVKVDPQRARRLRVEVWESSVIVTLTSFIFVETDDLLAPGGANADSVEPRGGGCSVADDGRTNGAWFMLLLGVILTPLAGLALRAQSSASRGKSRRSS
jgi:predicted metal-dependent phosphoesterase TrpH